MKICDLSKQSSVFGIAKSCTVPYLVNVICGQILSVLWPKTRGQQMCFELGHRYDARSKYQTEVQVFPDEQPVLTMPLFANSSADLLSELV